MTFPEKLVQIRAILNLSQEQLAKELLVSFSTVNRWEGGKNIPTKKAVAAVREFCKGKGIEWEEIQ